MLTFGASYRLAAATAVATAVIGCLVTLSSVHLRRKPSRMR
jgi:hypothetical protein